MVGEFAELAGTRTTLQDDRLAHCGEERRGEIKILLRAADHDGQRTFAGTAIAARDRRIERAEAFRRSLGRERTGESRARRGHVDEHTAGLSGRHEALRTAPDFFDIIRVAHHRDHRVDALGCLSWRSGPLGAEREEVICLGLRAGVDRDLMARLEQVSHHALAHHSRADERDFHGRSERRNWFVGKQVGLTGPVSLG